MLDAPAIRRVYEGFREGRPEPVRVVRGWIDAIVRGGRWGLADPEGVAQEILLRVYDLARAGRVEQPGAFQKLVQVVAKNRCVTHYHEERRRARHEGPEPEIDAPATGERADDAMIRREELALVLRVVQGLPDGCRALWNWVYRERLDAAEVGRRLGISAGNVRVRVHRCLEAAREAYRKAADPRPAAATERA